jgi:recombination protein RecA
VKGAENKCAPPFTEAEFEIRYGTGVDVCAELIDLGVARGLVEKSGNHLSFAGTTLGNGRETSRDALEARTLTAPDASDGRGGAAGATLGQSRLARRGSMLQPAPGLLVCSSRCAL